MGWTDWLDRSSPCCGAGIVRQTVGRRTWFECTACGEVVRP